ncbi:uncharacterized protein LOC123524111 [Mercenaria mercenaria]|uniref:uncharacterized protein LOC123524111 n=1 Tax=Mercenaria mercenaria TaxID=6596 RepID=UPI00234E6188|nr:uncharacterized protein LOC123524111 [Mercenaria mercenaria]XP_045157985.2 uncharacterized protein LOC123524111 [Mercenaria mercenaria]
MCRMTGVDMVLLVFALLACLISFSSGLFSNVEKEFKGKLEPLDPNKCETQNITFTSTLLDDPRPNSSIGFAFKKISTNKKYVAVDIDRVTKINETVSQFTEYNLTLENEEATKPVYFYIRSYYWEDFGDTDDKLQLGETTSVRVYPLPEKVQDFNCIVRNYKTMNCSWNYGIEYVPDTKPEVIFQWKSSSVSAPWKNCSDLNIDNGYCYWTNLTAGYFENSNITIRLTLNQHCGINVSSVFPIDISRIVKPNPVSRISSKVVNSTCIQLLWNTTDSEPQHPKEHRVIVFAKGTNVKEVRFNTTKYTEQFPHSRTFCKLHPYTEYTFSVSIQPTGTFSGYFSDPRNSVSMTYSDIPSASPKVTEGGYRWKHRDCEGKNQKRKVCIFWKSIKEEHENGPMKGLKGEFIAIHKKEKSVQEDWSEDLTYGCSQLLCDTTYNFTVKARNVNGTSERVSTLTIHSFTTEIKRPQFIVESANTSDVYISWEDTGDSSAEKFTVAWCHNKDGDCESDHEVHWRSFPSGTNNAVLQTNASPSQFLYGVGVLTQQGSSGVDWQDCVYLKDITPKREPQNMVVSPGSEDNTLIVTWDKLTCRSDEPYIDMYNVRYNKVNDRYQKSVYVKQSGEARAVLRDLEEDQVYVVTVRGATRDGRYGPDSLPMTGVPVNKSLKPSEIIGISMAVLVGVILAGVGVFCAVRRCKRRAQEVIKQAGAITIPDAPAQEVYTHIGRQDSNDSGFETTPPPDKSTKRLSSISFVLPNDYRCETVCNGDKEPSATDMYVLNPEMTRPVHVRPDMSMLQNELLGATLQDRKKSNLTLVIPKPVAFIEQTESGMSLSREENNFAMDTMKDKSIDNVKSKRVPPDSADDTVNGNAPIITNIPCPKVMLEHNDSSFGHVNEYLPSLSEDNCHHSMDIASSSVVPQSKPPLTCTGNIIQDNEKSYRSGYVTTTASPSLFQQSNHLSTGLRRDKSDISDVSDKHLSGPCTDSNNDTLPQYPKSLIAQNPDTFIADNKSIKDPNTESGSLTTSPATSSETPDCRKQSYTAHGHYVSQKTLPADTTAIENAILLNNYQLLIGHPCAIQTSTGGVQNKTVSENTCTNGYVPHSYTIQDNNMTCSNAALGVMKIDGYVPHVNMFTDNVMSDAVQSYIPNGIKNRKNNPDSHSLPETFAVDTNVDPGYVFSTDVNVVCQPTERKYQSDVKSIERAKHEYNNHASKADEGITHGQIPIEPFNHVSHRNTKPKNTSTEDVNNTPIQNCVDNMRELQRECVCLKEKAGNEQETESQCKAMHKDGYISHLVM